MFDRHSRYRDARPFVPLVGETETFRGVRPRVIGRATGVIEHQVRTGDRLDLLARHYYNNDRLWWRIVDANPEFWYAGDMVLDHTLRKTETDANNNATGDHGDRKLNDMLGKTILIPRATG